MEGNEHSHRPKMAKLNAKLPDVFKTGRTVAVGSKRAAEQTDQAEGAPVQVKQVKSHGSQKSKSRNPFLPVREYLKMAQKIQLDFKEANEDFNMDRLVKYSIDQSSSRREQRIKYENCVTLSTISRTRNCCLKKVFHVPTLSVHYLRQSLISMSIDRNDLVEWMAASNRSIASTNNCIRVIQLFWNTPQNYYSLLYDYAEGISLQYLINNAHSLPMSLISTIAKEHLASSISIFNSQIIINDLNSLKQIQYLPIYEETEFTMTYSSILQQAMQTETGPSQASEEDRTELRLMWRLGLLILISYVGDLVVDEDAKKIKLPLRKCCLFHELLEVDGSLTAILIDDNKAELKDEGIEEFLCSSLRSKNAIDSGEHPRPKLKTLRESMFLKRKYPELLSLKQIIQAFNPSSNSKATNYQINKMIKLKDSVGLILQNLTAMPMTISADNKGIQHLARQLGMSNQIDMIVAQLRKVYREER